MASIFYVASFIMFCTSKFPEAITFLVLAILLEYLTY